MEVEAIDIRDVSFKLNTSNRSLKLCARMNYETEILDFIDACKPGSVLFDIGACEGRFSIYAVKKGLNVHAFEPETMNFSALSSNEELNELPVEGFNKHNVAVSDTNGKGNIQIGQPWPGGHQKVVDHGVKRQDLDFNFKTSQEITLVKLDDYIKTNSLPKPDYLKVDVDGSEIPFLKGAEHTLSGVNLKGIMFELNKTDDSYQDIIVDLEKYKFEKKAEYQVPNEPNLFNIWFIRKNG